MRILYLDVDSLRPDHLGCYGYPRATSPNIDRVASQGVVFEGVYASDVPCLPSRTAFFGGRLGTITSVVNHGGLCADLPPEGVRRGFRSSFVENSMVGLLRRAGIYTASVSPFPWRHSAYQAAYGFRETRDPGKGGMDNADEVYPIVAEWLESRGREPNWFLHVNLWDPHTPYDSPEWFGSPFADELGPTWLTPEILAAQRASFGPHSAREVPDLTPELPSAWRWGVGEIRDLADAKAHFDGYDAGVAFADLYIGKILEDLERLGVLEETAIVIAADHGENLGELNVWGDHQTADEFTCHLPCVVRWPGATDSVAGTRIPGLRYHLDLAATLVDLAGAEVPNEWDGRSLRSAIAGDDSAGRNELVLSQGAWACQRALRWENMLLIRTYDAGWKDFPEFMLFDLADDPHETRDLAGLAKYESVVREGAARIDAWLGDVLPRSLRGDPFEIVIDEGGPLHANRNSPALETYRRRLEATGRADCAARLGRAFQPRT